MHTEKAAAAEEAIRTRAYHLWEADGRQHGRDDHYWREAMAQLEAESTEPAEPADPISQVNALPAVNTESTKPKRAPKAKNAESTAVAPAKGGAVGDTPLTEVIDASPKRTRKAAPPSDAKPVKAKTSSAKGSTADNTTAGKKGNKSITAKAETPKPAAKRSKETSKSESDAST